MKIGRRATALAAGCFLAGLVVAQDPRPDPALIFKIADKNGDGKLSREEFAEVAGKNPRLKDNPDLIKKAFDTMDANKDGFLSPDEFGKAPMFQGKGDLKGKLKKGFKKDETPAAPQTPPAPSKEELLLTEIRDLMKAKQ